MFRENLSTYDDDDRMEVAVYPVLNRHGEIAEALICGDVFGFLYDVIAWSYPARFRFAADDDSLIWIKAKALAEDPDAEDDEIRYFIVSQTGDFYNLTESSPIYYG